MSRKNNKEILLLELNEAELLIHEKSQQKYGTSEKGTIGKVKFLLWACNSKGNLLVFSFPLGMGIFFQAQRSACVLAGR